MEIKKLALKNLILRNNVFLAPMAGYTDYAFRNSVIPLGVGLSFTELASAKGIVYGGKANAEILECSNDEDYTAVQIFGADAYYMRSACENEQLSKYKIVDINMGCPVPKVYKNGEGSALLKDIHKAEEIISECVKSGKIITVKIRTGLKKGDDIATEYAKMAENAGASLITIHGRVREDYYSGEPDFNAISKAKQAVSIPVIANGGIFTEADADNMMDKTGADGVMLARGAIADPFLISRLTNTKTNLKMINIIINQLSIASKMYGDKRASLEFRKFAPYYLKGMPHLKDKKIKLQTLENTEEIISIMREIF